MEEDSGLREVLEKIEKLVGIERRLEMIEEHDMFRKALEKIAAIDWQVGMWTQGKSPGEAVHDALERAQSIAREALRGYMQEAEKDGQE